MNTNLASDLLDAYAKAFAQARTTTAQNSAWLAPARKQAFDAFSATGFPTTKQEDWRFTDVSPLTRIALVPAEDASNALPDLGPDKIGSALLALGRGHAHRLVMVNGHLLSDDPGPLPQGLSLMSLSSAMRSDAHAVGALLARQLRAQDAFVALNTAFFADGAYLRIPDGVVVEAPIVLVFVYTGQAGARYARTLVHAGAGSQATLVELHVGSEGTIATTNAATEIVLEAGARLAHHTVQRISSTAFHVGNLAVMQKAGSQLTATNVFLAGKLARNGVRVELAEADSACSLHGLYLATGHDHVDNHTLIDHRARRTTSRESYQGVVDDRGKAVFDGRIVVRPNAQGTDARQTNRNLVLADGAVVHAKPHLEIFANDVKCSHGATTGRLDQEALFYLRSRGIGQTEATRMLIRAFLLDELNAVEHARLREELQALLEQRVVALGASETKA